jgi:hypothetical protein
MTIRLRWHYGRFYLSAPATVELFEAIEAWAAEVGLARSEAVRQLIEAEPKRKRS